jgi:hypothetical protein
LHFLNLSIIKRVIPTLTFLLSALADILKQQKLLQPISELDLIKNKAKAWIKQVYVARTFKDPNSVATSKIKPVLTIKRLAI